MRFCTGPLHRGVALSKQTTAPGQSVRGESNYGGFPRATLTFLRALQANNDREWFAAHRDEYLAAYVEPARGFVAAVAPGLRRLVAELVVEPKIGGSIRRVHRDARFVRDGAPFKDHLGLSFWEGEPRPGMPALFLRLAPRGLEIGAGCRGPDAAAVRALRSAIASPDKGKALARLVRRLERRGFVLGGDRAERVPRGFETAATAPLPAATAELLRHRELFVVARYPASAARTADVVKHCLADWRAMLPVYRWLRDEVDTG